MRIKKTFQGSIPANKIVNTSSTSKTDTYSCDYINNLATTENEYSAETVYSTEEQVIGKWIDGKPLYRKVVTGTVTTGETQINLHIDTLDFIRDISGIIKYYSSDGTVRMLPISRPHATQPSTHQVGWYYSGTTKRLAIEMGSAYTASDMRFYIAVEYTKTTDTGEV